MPINNPVARGKITSGSYLGDSTVNRAIPHGLGDIPRLVFIVKNAVMWFVIINRVNAIQYLSSSAQGAEGPVTAVDATNFYVGIAANYNQSANSVETHYWVAMV